MTNVGELFVSLGVKGADKTMNSLKGVGGGLSNLLSLSFEAKAALVGAAYALERLFSASGKKGTELTNFNAAIGMSTKTLQQYEYAAQQVGVSNQEVASTFSTLQGQMAKMLLGESGPKLLGVFARAEGDVSPESAKRFGEHPEELLQKLQHYAQTEKNVLLRNQVLESFGLNENMIAALSRGAFSQKNLAKAPTYSDKEIGNLDKANAGWKNLGTSIEMMVGRFNAQHGLEFVNDLQKLIPPFERLLSVANKFIEKIHLFDGIKAIFEGAAKAVDFLSKKLDEFTKSGFIEKTSKNMTSVSKELGEVNKSESFQGVKEVFSSLFSMLTNPALVPTNEDLSKLGKGTSKALAPVTDPIMDRFADVVGKMTLFLSGESQQSKPNVLPKAPATKGQQATQNVNINQTMNFQSDGSNAQEAGDIFANKMRSTISQIPAIGQGS